MEKNGELYPFYDANIHEQRWMAYIARATPLGSMIFFCAIILYGVFACTPLLLAVTAVFNVTMWLWISTTAFFGILGAIRMRQSLLPKSSRLGKPTPGASHIPTIGAGAENLKHGNHPVANAAIDPESQGNVDKVAGPIFTGHGSTGRGHVSECASHEHDGVTHVVVFPNYEEDAEMMAETLLSLSEAEGSRRFWVVLGMEEREKDVRQKAEKLQQKFAPDFAEVLVTFHPPGLEEKHLDGSVNLEVPGKASNLKWAVNRVHEKWTTEVSPSAEGVMLTCADADCLFHPSYFATIGKEFCIMREAQGEQHKWTMWQPPQLPYLNYYESPVPSRVWGYISSVYEFGGVCSLAANGHHMVFSSYSLGLELAVNAKCWDGDVISEDHHTYIKGFFYSIYASATEALGRQGEHKAWEEPPSCHPALRVRGVPLPVKSTSVVSSEGYWQSWIARWHQATRHCQGVAELSYSILATWDMLWTLPLGMYNLHFVTVLVKAVFRSFLIHVVPVVQSFALGVLTIYWVLHGRMVPGCPDRIWMASSDGETLLCGLAGAWVLTWPIVIPFFLVAVANFMFLWTAFLLPAEAAAQGEGATVWHKADGGIRPMCGSKLVACMCTICVDCLVFVGPLMLPYGLLAEIVGCWNVFRYGNHFKYITAAKMIQKPQDYGSMK